MKPIRFYQIPFSHFCDKVRWGFNYYSIPYKSIDFVARRKIEGLAKAPKSLQKLVPIIEDPNNESLFLSDSTPILIYLDQHYRNDKTLFPLNKKSEIVQYCLKLDSQLGLYARRLAYLYIINEKPSLLSMLVNGNYTKSTCDDWKSYFQGLLGSCIIIARFGLNKIENEKIFEKTNLLLNEIQSDIKNKKYLFNEQFTAADLTLTSLIEPLRIVSSFSTNYKTIFDYCDRIRTEHDHLYRPAHINRLFQMRKTKQNSFISSGLWHFFNFIFYPLQYLFNDKNEIRQYQYPSKNINEKADNDNQIINLKSPLKLVGLLIRNLYHFYFTLPKQLESIRNQEKKKC